MSVGGLCQVCERARATEQCPNCGTLVCSDHFREGHGVCVQCAPGGSQL